MMIRFDDIHSLTDFKRKTIEYMKQLKKSGRPAVLTVNGKAELVVQDAASYQRLLDLVDLAESNAAIRESFAQYERGEWSDAREVIEKMRDQLKKSPNDP